MKKNTVDFNNLNDTQKVNYVKNLLFNCEINEALDTLLKNEKKDLKVIKIILSVLDEELIVNRIKEQCNLNTDEGARVFVCSKILGILAFYNKTMIINSFLKNLSEEKRKQIAIYEYQNKTSVSIDNKIFNKYCSKYKSDALNNLKPSDEETLMLTMEIKRYNLVSKKRKIKEKNNKRKLPIILFLISLMIILLIYKIYDDNKLLSKYNDVIYPGIYLNDTNLSKLNINDLTSAIEKEKQRIESGKIVVTNVNGDYEFSYKELGINLDCKKVLKDIKSYNANLSRFQKLKMIKNNKRFKTFYLDGNFDDEEVGNFITDLEKKLNTNPREDGLIVDDNYNVYYDKGTNGFKLDAKKTKEELKRVLATLTEESLVVATGDVVKNEIKHESLSKINKKVSSYTTYFNNVGNRGHNVSLASSKLNNTILMPGETFSYLKVVGPYNGSNGYLPAPVYSNGKSATANGGGVCQLASTLYNAQLRAGLQTLLRHGHTYAPAYVPKGLDSTVYSTTADYKFKNQYEYPVYIVSYVKGNYLTVDIWTNEDALGGKTYEPYSIYSNGGYLAYLKVIEDGKVIETKYLDKTYYRAH